MLLCLNYDYTHVSSVYQIIEHVSFINQLDGQKLQYSCFVWYISVYGLSCINTKEEVFQFSIGVKVASTTCCDRRGNIIIGTARGECVFDKSEEKVKIGNTEVSAIATMNKVS